MAILVLLGLLVIILELTGDSIYTERMFKYKYDPEKLLEEGDHDELG